MNIGHLCGKAINRRMRLFVILMLAVLATAAVACSGKSTTPAQTSIVLTDPVANPTATPQPIVTSFEGEVQEFEVNLAVNGSPQAGTAVFTRKNDFAHVEIKLRPGVAAQTVTLRHGVCPSPEGFVESFNLAIGGILRQEMRDVPFDDLLVGGLTLVVNTSDNAFNEYAACADLPKVE